MGKIKKTNRDLRKFHGHAMKYLTDNGYFEEYKTIPPTETDEVLDENKNVVKEKSITPPKHIQAHWTKKDPTKLVFCIKDVIKNQLEKKIFVRLDNAGERIMALNAAKDPVKNTILYEPGSTHVNPIYSYTPEGKEKMLLELQNILDEESEIYPRIPEDWATNDLSEEQMDIFSGIVIPEQEGKFKDDAEVAKIDEAKTKSDE